MLINAVFFPVLKSNFAVLGMLYVFCLTCEDKCGIVINGSFSFLLIFTEGLVKV